MSFRFLSHRWSQRVVNAFVLLGALLLSQGMQAQTQTEAPGPVTTVAMPKVVPGHFDGDVRNLPQVSTPQPLHSWNEWLEPEGNKPDVLPGKEVKTPESAPIVTAPMPSPTVNFAGLSFTDSVTGGTGGSGWPPDVNGDVGPNHYIEAVNDSFAIYDKTGVRLAAFTENSLWSGAGTGTPCDANNAGDPVVLHDGITDRWILTNFAFAVSGGNPVAPFYQCFAVSKTSNPVTGGWFLYAVRMDPGGAGAPPAGTLNDYGKLGLWTDCLYMGANHFTMPAGTFAGTSFASFSRSDMYAGLPLTSAVGFIANTTNPFTMIPSNIAGTGAGALPSAGTPNYFVSESGTAFAFEVRKFTAGANCGAGGSLGAATVVSQTSYSGSGPTVPQPSTTNKLDTLYDRLMQKVQYRKVGTAESLWVVHTVAPTTAATNRPQWAQINVTGGTVATTPVQQQIYAPDTTLHRWMGSLAVDKQGNMALGYSLGNATTFPSIAYSGRLVGDAVNTLPQTEVVMQAGAGSQTNNCGGAPCTRWGDYTAMSLDPADDCTFWYINEYYDSVANGASGNWHTRIGAFKFPGCVGVGPASKLAFSQQPSNAVAGVAIAPAITVQVQDASGNLVTSSSAAVTLAIGTNVGGATLSGTVTVNAVSGVATFSNLSMDKIGSGYTLTAASSGLTGATSSTFNITPAAAAKLAFSVQPTNTTAGVAISPAIAVQVQDAFGNQTTSTASVTVAIGTNPGASTLSGTTTVAAVAGVATFSNLSLNKVGTGYTLTAASAPLTGATSASFNITVGAASKVAFAQQPSNTAAGTAISPAITVQVQDANGNVVTGSSASITLAIGTNPGGSTLSGTTTVVAVSGVATFSNLSLNKSGTGYTLTAASAPLTGATSSAFNITAGAASKLAFAQQPTNTVAGAAIAPAMTVQVQDANGNLVTSSSASVTLAIGTNVGGATLSGTVTANAVSGVATFSNLSMDKIGSGYTLTAASSGLTGATSSTFNITPAAAAKLAFSVQPTNTTAGVAISPAIAVQVQDAFGNQTTSTASVTVAIGTNPGASTLSGTTTVAAVAGVATFSNLSLNKVGTGYTLTAASAPLTGATSASFNITAAAAAKLGFGQQPTDTAAGAAIAPAVTVRVLDAFDNLTTSTASITIAIGTNPGSSTLSGTTTVAALAGVATFSNLSLNKSGTGYTLTAASAPLTGATSSAFNITAGAASKLAFAQQPTNTVAGAAIAPAITVQVQDANGNVVSSSSASVTLAIGANPGSATLSGTATVNAASGIATFSNLSLDKIGSGYTLTAASGALTGATSSAFNITPGAAVQLAFGQQPSDSTAGVAISPAVTVRVLDAFGNLTASTASITMAIGTNPGGSTLSGSTTVSAVSGVATFSTLSLDKIGTGYTLTAASGVLTGATSASFNVTSAAAAKLVFGQQPSDAAAGAAIAPAVTVRVLDAFNNLTNSTASVTLAIGTNPGSSTLGGTTTVAAVGGVATFSNLSLDKVGTGYTLTAASGVLTGATSSAFNITAGAAAKLVFGQQPSDATAGASIAPAVTVRVLDAFNNPTSSTASVTLAIGTNPGSSTLSGTTTVAAVSGVATFSNLSLDKVGTGYTLTATSGVLSGATSSAFNINVGAAAKLVFGQQPSDTTAGSAIAPAVTVRVLDAFDNLTTSTASITVAIGANPGGSTLSGTTTVSAVSGVATLSTLSLDKVGVGYTLTAASGVLTGATSSTFNITGGAAGKLAFAQQPSNAVAGVAIAPAITVEVQDASGNLVTTSSAAVTLAIGTNPGGSTLSGTVTVNAVNGVATFGNLSLDKTGTGYTLTAASGVLAGASSSTFDISAAAAAKLAFNQQPTNTAAGVAIAPAVTVRVLDAFNNLTASTASITVAIGTNPGSSTLSGTTTIAAVGGVATFSTLSLDKMGTGYTLTAASGALTGATSSAFNVTAGAPAKLAFGQQPGNATAGAAISPAVTVRVLDAFNNPTASTASVTLTIGTNPGSSTLSGTTTVAAVGGVATFSNLSLNKVGTGYTLSAASTPLTGATSSAFNITAGTPSSITFTTQPASGSNVTAGAAIPLVAHVQDADGNPVAGDAVTLAFVNNAGGSTLTVTTNPVNTNASGDASFAGVSLDKAATGYTLKVTEAVGAQSVTGNAFNVVAAAASQLVFTTQPVNVLQGERLATVVVTERDTFGNTVNDNGNVTFTIAACSTNVNVGVVAMVNGVATLSSGSSPMFYAVATARKVDAATASLNTSSQNFNVLVNSDLLFPDGFESCRL